MRLIAVTNKNESLGKQLMVTQKQIDDALILSVPDAIQTAKETSEKARPFFIEAENKIVGFTMFAFDEIIENENYRYWLWQLMIDKNEQGKGVAKQALPLVIDYFKNEGVPFITLSTKPNNTPALALYKKFGFIETGEWNDTEIILQKKIVSETKVKNTFV